MQAATALRRILLRHPFLRNKRSAGSLILCGVRRARDEK
jgi:hypothetical protein